MSIIELLNLVGALIVSASFIAIGYCMAYERYKGDKSIDDSQQVEWIDADWWE